MPWLLGSRLKTCLCEKIKIKCLVDSKLLLAATRMPAWVFGKSHPPKRYTQETKNYSFHVATLCALLNHLGKNVLGTMNSKKYYSVGLFLSLKSPTVPLFACKPKETFFFCSNIPFATDNKTHRVRKWNQHVTASLLCNIITHRSSTEKCFWAAAAAATLAAAAAKNGILFWEKLFCAPPPPLSAILS